MDSRFLHAYLAAADTGASPGDLVKWILASVGLLLFLGASANYLRGSADKGAIASLKGSVDALQIENGLLKQTVASQGERISKLEGENATLKATVTQAEEIKHLQSTLEGHHTQSMTKFDELIGAIAK